VNYLINHSLSPATRLQYNRNWQEFIDFLKYLDIPTYLPIAADDVAMYVSHLWRKEIKITSIRTKLAAISFFHNIRDIKDPCKSFMIKQLLKGTVKCMPVTGNKLKPINKTLLHDILTCFRSLVTDTYEYYLYSAIFLLSYYCCLRAGEAVVSNTDQHTLNINQISFEGDVLFIKLSPLIVSITARNSNVSSGNWA